MTPYEKIYLMNALMGHQQEPFTGDVEKFWKQMDQQANLVNEETTETLDAIIDRDLEGFAKEVADVMVVAIGLYQKLHDAGINMIDVLDKVCDNNLEKFHRDSEHANETVKFYQDQGVDTFVRVVVMEDGQEYFAVIRKADNKMMKPHDFEKLLLSNLVE